MLNFFFYCFCLTGVFKNNIMKITNLNKKGEENEKENFKFYSGFMPIYPMLDACCMR